MYISFAFKKPVVWGIPYTVTIEPTCLCNLSCPECPVGMGIVDRKKRNLDMETYKRIIDEIKRTTIYLILYFQGEPFMHQDLYEMVRYAEESGIYTSTSTNGMFVSEETVSKIIVSGLSRLIISIDGTTQASYEKYRRGGDLQKILNSTSLLIRQKHKENIFHPYVIFQFVVFRHNIKEVGEIKEIGKKVGVDKVLIKTAQIYSSHDEAGLLPDDPMYSRYKIDEQGNLKIKGNLGNQCKRLWRTVVITTDGELVPCCFDKNANHPMGSIEKSGLKSIWKNRRYSDFRRKILSGRRSVEICNNCSEGLKIYV